MIETKTVCPEIDTSTSVFEKLEVLERTTQKPPVEAPIGAPGNGKSNAPTGPAEPARWRPKLRQLLFRCVRLVFAGILIYGAGVYFWNTFTQVSSEQAVVTTDILALRSPIEGQLQIDSLTPGAEVLAGITAFRVVNARFGNKEAAAQLNWSREQVERLQTEAAEATVRLEKQEEIFKYHQRLYDQKVTAVLDYLNEEARVAVARSGWSNKLTQLRQAETRRREVEQQVALQKEADVSMPFAGMVWAVAARDGAPVSANETVLRVFDPRRVWVEAFIHEKHADKFAVGVPVFIRTIDGRTVWEGRVETIRGRGGPSTSDSVMSLMPAEPPQGRMAVRVKMEKVNPFTTREFYGVGRSVIVSLEKP
jgi:multidrug resistance efflux pump